MKTFPLAFCLSIAALSWASPLDASQAIYKTETTTTIKGQEESSTIKSDFGFWVIDPDHDTFTSLIAYRQNGRKVMTVTSDQSHNFITVTGDKGSTFTTFAKADSTDAQNPNLLLEANLGEGENSSLTIDSTGKRLLPKTYKTEGFSYRGTDSNGYSLIRSWGEATLDLKESLSSNLSQETYDDATSRLTDLLISKGYANPTFGTGSNQFAIEFVNVGKPNNKNDREIQESTPIIEPNHCILDKHHHEHCADEDYTQTQKLSLGRVSYTYLISKYIISQSQIAMAVASGLPGMPPVDLTAAAPPVTWYQAAAFVNWLNTSQGYAPAYNLSYSLDGNYSMALWPKDQAWNHGGLNLSRNKACHYFLPSENEWYKAAYYDPNKNGAGNPGYWPYSNGSKAAPINDQQSSPFGTIGQGIKSMEWMEPMNDTTLSVMRGDTIDSITIVNNFSYTQNNRGFRITLDMGAVVTPNSFRVATANYTH